MTSPESLLVKEDFDRSGWESVIAASDRRECDAYMSLFNAKAEEAEAAGEDRHRAVFVLLAAISSLHLRPESTDDPFGPMWNLNNSRSAIPEDFSDADLAVLNEVAQEASDAEIRARIADVIWVRKRDYRLAQTAVSAYLEAADALGGLDRWRHYIERIERATRLAASLGRSAAQFTTVIGHIESALDEHDEAESSFPFAGLMELLQEYRQGDAARYGALSERLASRAEDAGQWARAREYWEIKARWSQMDGDDEGRRDALVKAAEIHVKEADEALTRTPPSYIAVTSHLIRAIEGIRRAGGMQERVEELHRTLLEYQERTRSEMASISRSVDVTEFAERAREAVKGKTLLDSLVALALMLSPPVKADLRKNVEESAQGSITALVSMNVVNDSGRVVARRPSRFSNDPAEVEAATMADMYAQAAIHHQGFAVAKIEPARAQINLEHNPRVRDLLPFVSNNPFVPPGRELIYAQGLYNGLTGNFLVAVHLLIPQIEHSVRHILSGQDVIVSGLSSTGIQEERNLNATLYDPILEQLWGEDLTFDLQGLLVNRFGSNLRNKLAHGLMDYEDFSSLSIAYLWWITLYICYAHLAIQYQQNAGEGTEAAEDEDGSPDEE
jgi:hypothetical protein